MTRVAKLDIGHEGTCNFLGCTQPSNHLGRGLAMLESIREVTLQIPPQPFDSLGGADHPTEDILDIAFSDRLHDHPPRRQPDR